MTIQAIIFDLDNTLTHRDLSTQSYSLHFSQHYANALKQIDVSKITDIVRRIDHGGYPKKELLTHGSIGASIAHALLVECEWITKPNPDELTAFWFKGFGQCAVPMPDLLQVLDQLKARHYRLAIISNGGHETRMNTIEGLGITEYFDEIVSSGQLGMSKPQPEIFLYTAEKLAVAPAHCIYVGDHPINDIQGAKNAGMHALWMQGFHPEVGEIEHKIQNLKQILDFLDRLIISNS